MTSAMSSSKKLRLLLLPFFATSHIGPFTDLAVRLTTASSDAAVEATVAVTPGNLPLLESLLERHGRAAARVKAATYPFPAVDGIPEGVENLSKAAPGDAWRIDAAAFSEALMRPVQEPLIRAQSPDAVVTDIHFYWNAAIANDLGVPCVQFTATGAFPAIAMRHLGNADVTAASVVVVPEFPGPDIRIPSAELPEFLRSHRVIDDSTNKNFFAAQADCFGLAANTFSDLEQPYMEIYLRNSYAKRAYFLGPLSLPPPSPADADGTIVGDSECIDWLDSKPDRSVVYVCFGSLAPVSDHQLHQLALGLEASGQSFMWVVRAENWSPPEGWVERVGDRGKLLTAWAPQTAILAHPAVGAFVTHCGWNSVMETVAAGVPVLTWPMVFEQFINERLLTEVLGIGERLWPDGAGVRSTRYEEHEVIPAEAVARALTAFMQPGGPVDVARTRAMALAVKAQAAVAEGGSSHSDLHRLLDDLMEASSGGHR
ncbi:UDP-glycosyltransferase 73C4-like [Lolium rigidum]|uniref:UDP-glycosyltransferase 73C4-like n=1 Tax=Lolium rigidum TaxID=89674 RepID=UPI001F5C93F1|nr:UDP-glycosyltransferase 73C4-like [Lolium rigidum]